MTAAHFHLAFNHVPVVLVPVAAVVLLGWTAYLGGRINHPELR
jgi:hypothetical protein